MSKICRHCVVSGTVQGVFYRQNTKQQAELRNLTGWVRNLDDGRVEALICGEENLVAELQTWMQRGPPRAIVTKLEVNDKDYDDQLIGFIISK